MIRPLLSIGALTLGASITAAGDLGEKILFDGAKVPGAKWQTEKGVTVATEGATFILRSGGLDYGWAATGDRLPLVEAAVIDLDVAKTSNGQLALQIEWFDSLGKFIGATNVLQQATTGTRLEHKKLSSFTPKEGKPRQFALKFWVEGRNAEIQISNATVHFLRSWHSPNTRLVKAYGGNAKLSPEKGITVASEGESLVARLGSGTAYSGFVCEDRVEYSLGGVVLLDVAKLENGVLTVQVLCWNGDGTFRKAVDLMKDVSAPGSLELPIDLVKDQIPSDTARVSFKIWLSGRETSARIDGLYYGIALGGDAR